MLFKEEKDEKQKKKSVSDIEFYADTMEEEKTRAGFDFVNRQKSTFANSNDYGLNKERGVFNSTAIFHTGQN